MFSSTDILRILCKSVILTFVFFIAICFGLDLFKVDIDIANALCKSLEIPKDLALTMMSPGFFNEVIILLVVFETITIAYFINKLSRNKIINSLYYKIKFL